MRTDKELLKDAVDAIEAVLCTECAEPWGLIEEIRDRLAEPEDEPYLYLYEEETVNTHKKIRIILDEPRFPPGVSSEKPIFPLYRHPHQSVRLSDEEIREVMLAHGFVIKDGHSDLKPYVFQAARAIEQAVLEKNQ